MQGLKPTQKQTRAMALITNGVNPSRAMQLSGYSKLTSRNPKENLLDKPQVKPLLEQFQKQLRKQGITIEYRVSKLKELLEANKFDEADYRVRIEALRILNEIDNIKEIAKQPRRKLTIEEFEDTNL